MTDELIAYCGLYCGACSFKVGFEENNKDHVRHMPSMYDKYKNQSLQFCPGCRLENQCGDCAVRDCARNKKIEYCSLCSDFPCKKLLDFNGDGKPHHAEAIENLSLLKDIGEEKWLVMQNRKWRCEKCNSRFSWYLKRCVRCDE
ncbi:DUF3795 domain-containing protein [Desulfosporosinus sp. PR]|uniref:DUF3795 domain-containing protein n=1 Tax=Candidatus Desulfosporosinus nitrosoreducens TaxID=3401928 RepID=UPI0027EC2F86|nr:DUF3795 domain-containing protein [Desulfosporosinus sp. PR]MDQ7094798.1 DUF3795 domain-containing protein [Desulfosporosinus sp. PR]